MAQCKIMFSARLFRSGGLFSIMRMRCSTLPRAAAGYLEARPCLPIIGPADFVLATGGLALALIYPARGRAIVQFGESDARASVGRPPRENARLLRSEEHTSELQSQFHL